MDWISFKEKSEKHFETLEIEECWGYQIQPGTKWNKGLTEKEIKELESLFGFELPVDYKDMLLTMNGLDKDQISIDPDGKEEDEFDRRLYKYPEDFNKPQWLISQFTEFEKYIHDALSDKGFDVTDIVGYVPMYGHRALVVFNDKMLSPVVSIHGDDVIVYGKDIMDYWEREFSLNYEDC